MKMQRSSKSTARKLAAGLLAGAAAVLLFLQSGERGTAGRTQLLRALTEEELAATAKAAAAVAAVHEEDDDDRGNDNEGSSPRPVMHTFYSPVVNTGMSKVAESGLVEAWEEAWRSAGWDTRILTMEDAERHPSYNKYHAYMNKYGHNQGYDAMCFWRWLAMATVDGGGWMSDFDTFPVANNFTDQVGKNLPNGGKLTVYQSYVPALVSGVKEEWDRVGRLLLDTMEEKEGLEHHWSDMYALVDVHKINPNDVKLSQSVANPKMVIADWKNKEGCKLRDSGKIALHCAHADISRMEKTAEFLFLVKESKLRGDMRMMEQRTEICKQLVAKWKETCSGSTDYASSAAMA